MSRSGGDRLGREQAGLYGRDATGTHNSEGRRGQPADGIVAVARGAAARAFTNCLAMRTYHEGFA